MKRPKSCTSLPINTVGLLSFLFTFYTIAHYQLEWPIAVKTVMLGISLALPIILLELFSGRITLPVDKTFQTPTNINRIAIKLLALYTIWGVIAFIYWVFPEYRGSFYKPFWTLLLPALPWLIGLSIPYIWFVDQRMEQPKDSYFLFGRWILGRGTLEKSIFTQLFLGWLVKLFFLPLMVVYFGNNIETLTGNYYSWAFVNQKFQHLYDYLYVLFFTIDLAFVCIGYVLTLRLLNSHIRSTEPTLLGWFSALICYQPFMSSLSALYLAYNMDNLNWGGWLEGNETAYVIWGSLILALLFIYVFSSLMFGIRFSNLTHRGIITDGPYRYSKHPAYLAKNLSWWMISIPFISQNGDIADIIRACSMLLLMNTIYFIRAKTEERHLMQDPVYQDYAAWIGENGFIAKLKKQFKFSFCKKTPHV